MDPKQSGYKKKKTCSRIILKILPLSMHIIDDRNFFQKGQWIPKQRHIYLKSGVFFLFLFGQKNHEPD
jgi:hypothetical protein